MTEQNFTPEQYTAFSDSIEKYVREAAVSTGIPAIQTPQFGQKTYRFYIDADDSDPIRGNGLSDITRGRKVDLKYSDFELISSQKAVWVMDDEKNLGGNDLLARSSASALSIVVSDAEKIIFQGDAAHSTAGLVKQATQKNLTDAVLTTDGRIETAISELFSQVPSRYLSMDRNGWLLFVTPGILKQMRAGTNKNSTTGEYEFSRIARTWMVPEAGEFKINQIISTPFLKKDTLTTSNQMMLLLKPEKRICGKVVSIPLGILGEDKHAVSTEVQLGWMGAGCVFDANAVIKSQDLIVTAA